MKGLLNEIKFDEKGLVPAIVQDDKTGEVLMMAYMDREAVDMTLKTGMAHYWSRSRQKLWKKGETSGHVQNVVSISPDCDNDSLLLKVIQKEAACHTGHYSCFYRQAVGDDIKEITQKVFDEKKVYGEDSVILRQLYEIIMDRQKNPKEGSYTNYLFDKGLDKILKKVGEEAAEVIIASKNKDSSEIIYEISDLIYHLFVLMVERGVKPGDIYEELKRRHKPE